MLSPPGCCSGSGLSPFVWGADEDAITISPGERIDLLIQYLDANGQPIQLGGVAIAVHDTNAPALLAASVSAENEEFGLVRLRLPPRAPETLRSGRLNWFRLSFDWPLFGHLPQRISSKKWIAIA